MAHILVVDGDPLYRDMVQAMLERAGHRVATAANRHQAEGTLRDQDRDDGFDAAVVEVRRRDDLPGGLCRTGWRKPILGLLDGDVDTEPACRAAAAPHVSALVRKPFTETELLYRLDRILASPDQG